MHIANLSVRLAPASRAALNKIAVDAHALNAGLDALPPADAERLAPLVQRLLDIVDGLDGPFEFESRADFVDDEEGGDAGGHGNA